jgi:leader peptidase (prepilin peptidase)/N-methyltransferase
MTPVLPIAIVAGVFGALVGSFLNVCIVRWPAEQSILKPSRSKCPNCGHQITWYENIPVVSWLALRGKCSSCGNRISIQYPLIELATAAIWFLAFLLPHISSLAPDASNLTSVRLAVFATVMLGVSVTDARFYVIPDGFTLFGFGFLLVTSVVALFMGDVSPFVTPWPAFLGACVGAGAIAIAGWLGEVAFKREAMGFGDATLMAVCGAALGPELALFNVFVAAALGAVFFVAVVGPIAWIRARAAKRDFAMPMVPFGVFLAPAAVVTLFYGQRVLEWYLGTLR